MTSSTSYLGHKSRGLCAITLCTTSHPPHLTHHIYPVISLHGSTLPPLTLASWDLRASDKCKFLCYQDISGAGGGSDPRGCTGDAADGQEATHQDQRETPRHRMLLQRGPTALCTRVPPGSWKPPRVSRRCTGETGGLLAVRWEGYHARGDTRHRVARRPMSLPPPTLREVMRSRRRLRSRRGSSGRGEPAGRGASGSCAWHL